MAEKKAIRHLNATTILVEQSRKIAYKPQDYCICNHSRQQHETDPRTKGKCHACITSNLAYPCTKFVPKSK